MKYDPTEIIYGLVRIVGYALMIISAYQLLGIWASLFLVGFIAWMPVSWIKS